MSCGTCKGIVGSYKSTRRSWKGMDNDGPYGGMCSKYCAAQGLKCVAQQTPKAQSDCKPVWNGSCTTPGGQGGASAEFMICECEGSSAKATTTTTQAPCVNDYDVGTVAKPWGDFESCSAEKKNCSEHPTTLQRHCRLTCGTCNGDDMKSTTDVKMWVFAGLLVAAALACGAFGGYYYHYQYEHTPRQEDNLASSRN